MCSLIGSSLYVKLTSKLLCLMVMTQQQEWLPQRSQSLLETFFFQMGKSDGLGWALCV